MRNQPLSRQGRAILEALHVRPLNWQYGYELCKLLGLGSGTLYPILIRLHDRGFLEAKWVEAERPGRPARHAYRLTPTGATFARSPGTLEPQASSSDAVFA